MPPNCPVCGKPMATRFPGSDMYQCRTRNCYKKKAKDFNYDLASSFYQAYIEQAEVVLKKNLEIRARNEAKRKDEESKSNIDVRDLLLGNTVMDTMFFDVYEKDLALNIKYEDEVYVQALFVDIYKTNVLPLHEFVIIKPRENKLFKWNFSYGFIDSRLQQASLSFTIVLQTGQIITHEGKDLGEGMAQTNEFIISNGDTEEYVRVDFETYSNQGKIVKAFIDVAIAKNARTFDFQRKCWFVQAPIIESLLIGIKTLINQGTLVGYQIIDKREKVESFEEFFTSQPEVKGGPLSKIDLLRDFSCLCLVSIVPDRPKFEEMQNMEIPKLKPIYRKMALAYHPDRNNGDGSKMSELNKIWTELQAYA